MISMHIYLGNKLVETVVQPSFCPRVGELVRYKAADYEVVSVAHDFSTNSIDIVLEL